MRLKGINERNKRRMLKMLFSAKAKGMKNNLDKGE